jgi:hypothetical protein
MDDDGVRTAGRGRRAPGFVAPYGADGEKNLSDGFIYEIIFTYKTNHDDLAVVHAAKVVGSGLHR